MVSREHHNRSLNQHTKKVSAVVDWWYILGPTTRWCPMSNHFLTTRVFKLLGLAPVSWAIPQVLVSIAVYPFALHISVFLHSLCHSISLVAFIAYYILCVCESSCGLKTLTSSGRERYH